VDYDVSSDQIMGWDRDLRAVTERIAGPLFSRPEPRATFADLVRGLLAEVPRKNSWQLADHVGHRSAQRLEWLLNGAQWDADKLRDAVRDYVVAGLGSDDGVLIADDTQVIKKGVKSVGVAPQHCGATGQTENCQVMPMLTYASDRGHAFIDRALYLPRCQTDDPQRCAEAGVPADRGFATKPQQVIAMLQRAIAAPGCRSGTSPPTPATAATPGCGPGVTTTPWPTCWPYPSTCPCSTPADDPPAPTSSSPA